MTEFLAPPSLLQQASSTTQRWTRTSPETCPTCRAQIIDLDVGFKSFTVTALLAATTIFRCRNHTIIHTFKRQQKGAYCLTEVSLTGLAAITASIVWHATRYLYSRVQGTGFGNRCHKILIVSISPAPPADFRLAAACNHCPIAHMSAKQARAG